jgi:hypothetical protein
LNPSLASPEIFANEAGPLIVIGVSMGFLADHQMGKTPMDNHKARLARNCIRYIPAHDQRLHTSELA